MDVKLSVYLISGDFLGVFSRDAEILGVWSLGRINFVRRCQFLWVLSMYRASCHSVGGRNFDVASTILKKLCPHVLGIKNKFVCLKIYLSIDRQTNIVLQNTLFIYWAMDPEIYNHNAEIEHFRK